MTTLVPEMLWDGACALEAEPQTVRRIRFPGITREPAKRTANRRVKYPHICAAAAALGVRRESIWRALEGQWHLPRLVARYRAFVRDLDSSPATKPKRTTK